MCQLLLSKMKICVSENTIINLCEIAVYIYVSINDILHIKTYYTHVTEIYPHTHVLKDNTRLKTDLSSLLETELLLLSMVQRRELFKSIFSSVHVKLYKNILLTFILSAMSSWGNSVVT